MIAYLKGVLTEKDIAKVVVECCGVGYEVSIPLSTFDRLPADSRTLQVGTCRVNSSKLKSLA